MIDGQFRGVQGLNGGNSHAFIASSSTSATGSRRSRSAEATAPGAWPGPA